MINMDMIGRLDPQTKTLIVHGTGTSPVWEPLLKKLENENLKIKTDSSGTGPSDHTSFYLKDVPVLHFFTGTHDRYHTPDDEVERIERLEGGFALHFRRGPGSAWILLREDVTQPQFDWDTRGVADGRYDPRARSQQCGAAMMLRLANAEILPYDYAEFARTVRGYVPGVEDALRAKGWNPAPAGVLRSGKLQFPDNREFDAFLALTLHAQGKHAEALALGRLLHRAGDRRGYPCVTRFSGGRGTCAARWCGAWMQYESVSSSATSSQSVSSSSTMPTTVGDHGGW